MQLPFIIATVKFALTGYISSIILYSRSKDGVENDVRKIGIVNWRQVKQDRDGWRRVTREVFIFLDSGDREEEKKKKEVFSS
jgi:hypothetical protein